MLKDLVYLLEENGDYNLTGTCNDCNKKILISIDRTKDGQIKISGGAIYKPEESLGYNTKYIYKCDECYNQDKILHQRTEVYTRVVGYLRPIKQFNPGKIAEFELRENYKIETSQQIF